MVNYTRIIGIGSYLPDRILTNDDLAKMVDTSDEWITARTGMRERHIAEKNETPTSMAEIAAGRALKDANIRAEELDLIIVTTSNPEKFFPSTACMLHGALQAKVSCVSFDLSAACSGFIYALTIADQFIQTGSIKKALIVSSEVMTSLVDWTDRNTCVLFGDGAGAVVLQADATPGILGYKLYSDGAQRELLYLSTGLYSPREKGLQMQGRELFKLASIAMIDSVKALLKSSQMDLAEVDWIIPHQANYRIVNFVIEKLNFPKEKVVFTIDEHSNTSSASIPLALDRAVKDGRVKRGQTLIFDAFGAGLTWGSILLRY
jgi:3-oxoacyl-[acyl-carrier-protein] synthase-3